MAQNKVRLSPDSWPARARKHFPDSRIYVGLPNVDSTVPANQKQITAKAADGTTTIT